MERPLLFSRLLQSFIVLSFSLPFFFVGCEKSDESAAAVDSTVAVDTLQVVPSDSSTASSDSLSGQISDTQDTIQIATNDKTEEHEEKSDFSKELIKEHEWLRPFLMPDKEIYTGLGLVLNIFRQSIFYNIFFSFLLILIGFAIKFLEKSAIRTQLLLNLLAIVFLYIYLPTFLSGERLWGFWVCLSLLVLTIALDIYRLILTQKKKSY
ncbi:MAG: hypothetical protein K0R51_452 [Cytophagaceae bacterium]|jgi:hypothetical protein|nr:hypothetical protein [Cytophagaceae bacterium]